MTPLAKVCLGFSTALLVLTGCKSTDDGSSQVSGGYYGAGFYDPWYYGTDHDCPPDVVVPPPTRPIEPPHVEHPIVLPPSPSPAPAPRPMPSIPMTPRASFRR
jgi:hypothetical protein